MRPNVCHRYMEMCHSDTAIYRCFPLRHFHVSQGVTYVSQGFTCCVPVKQQSVSRKGDILGVMYVCHRYSAMCHWDMAMCPSDTA